MSSFRQDALYLVGKLLPSPCNMTLLYIYIFIWSLKHRQNSLIGNDGQQSCSCGRHGGGRILAFRESNDVLLWSCSTVERPRRELHLTFYQLPEQINMNRPRLTFQQVVSLKKKTLITWCSPLSVHSHRAAALFYSRRDDVFLLLRF